MAADLTTRLRLLAHPVTTGALAALVVNDRVLKPWAFGLSGPLEHPVGVLTGKISDLAGVLLVALLTVVASGRRRESLVAVGLAFTGLKLSPAIADAAAPLLGGATRTDPTDLLALLVALPLADVVTGRMDEVAAPPTTGGSVVRRAPGPVVTFLVLVLTVPAVTATSCAEPQRVEQVAIGADGALWARIGDGGPPPTGSVPTTTTAPGPIGPGPPTTASGTADEERWARSADGGRTWVGVEAPSDAWIIGRTPSMQQDCADDGTCYRIVSEAAAASDPSADDAPSGGHRRRVEVGRSGRWTTSFAFSDEQWERLELRGDAQCGGAADVDDGISGILVVDDVVVVGNGSQGILRRGPSGEWDRVAVLDQRPLSLAGPSWYADLVWSPFVLGFAAFGLFLFAFVLDRGRGRAILVGTLAGGAAVALVLISFFLTINRIDYATVGPWLAGASTVVFLVSLGITLLPRLDTGPGSGAVGVLVATGIGGAILVLAANAYLVVIGNPAAVATPASLVLAAIASVIPLTAAARLRRRRPTGVAPSEMAWPPPTWPPPAPPDGPASGSPPAAPGAPWPPGPPPGAWTPPGDAERLPPPGSRHQ